ncbi:hypothetical protein [Flavobacterium olei]|uniref:hypothetical protein n=1 Tax=Flavobacterium olei TaxID=1886782 RepID=UPI00321BD683
MENITEKFIYAKSKFLESNASEDSVEKLYDLIYFLKGLKDITFEEKYILIKIYILVGSRALSSRIIEESLKTSDPFQTIKLKNLQSEMRSEDPWETKVYRDLRDSKIKKDSTKLVIEDLIISQEMYGNYKIKISDKIKNIVILNKNVPNEPVYEDDACFIFSDIKPDNNLLEVVIEYIVWLGGAKEDMLFFYNEANFPHKLANVGKDWFDGLSISNFDICIEKNYDFNIEIILHDYFQNDFGFKLKIKNQSFMQIEYDPIL